MASQNANSSSEELVFRLWPKPSDSEFEKLPEKTETATFLEENGDKGSQLIPNSKVPITRVNSVPAEGTYAVVNDTKRYFTVTAIAGRGTGGDVYRTEDPSVVIKIYKQGNLTKDEFAESIKAERKNLAQIYELFGIYTENAEPVLTLMRGFTGTRLKETELYKAVAEPVNDEDIQLEQVNAVVDRAMALTGENMEQYLLKYNILHTDIKDRNVLFTLGSDGKLESAQLIDWGEATTVDSKSMSPEEVRGLILKELVAGFGGLKATAKRRYDEAMALRAHREEQKKKRRGSGKPDGTKPWHKKVEEKKPDEKEGIN